MINLPPLVLNGEQPVGDGDDVHVVHRAGTIFYQKRAHDGGWSQPFIADSNGLRSHLYHSGTSGPRDTSPGSACRVIPVQFQEVGLKGTWGNAVLLVGESADRRPPPGNGININTLVNSSEHFIHAVAYATGDASPFRIKFAAVTDSGRAGGPETARDWQRNRRPAEGHTVALGWPRRSGTGVGEWRVPLQNGAGVALDGDGGNCCCCDDPRLRRGRVWLVGPGQQAAPRPAGARPAKSDTPGQAMNEQPYSLASVSWTCEVIGPYSMTVG